MRHIADVGWLDAPDSIRVTPAHGLHLRRGTRTAQGARSHSLNVGGASRSEPVSEYIGICSQLCQRWGLRLSKSIDSLKHLIDMKLDHMTGLTLLAPSFSNFNIRPPLPRRTVRREHRQIDLTGAVPKT